MAVIPMLAYENGAAAIDWLVERVRLRASGRASPTTTGPMTHAELETGIRDDHARDPVARLREPEASA